MEFFTPLPPENFDGLAMALIAASQAPQILLDDTLKVIAVSKSFCTAFHLSLEAVVGKHLGYLGQGEWNVPQLISLLNATVAGKAEIDAYASLVPDGSNWKATLLLEYPDVHERRRELARLIGVAQRVFVEVEGGAPRVHAIADEDLERETDEKTSAVHFLRFELSAGMIAAAKAA